MQSRSEQSRARILAAAREALVAGGGDFELADLARRAGVSVGLPYHRFGSKSGLIAAVVTEFYAGLRDAIDLRDVVELDWATRERERLRRLVAYLHGDPFSVVAISTLARAPEAGTVEAALWSETIAAAARNLRKAQARGDVPCDLDAALAAAMICGGVRHAIGLALAERVRRRPDALVEEIWSFVAYALRLAPAATGPSGRPSSRPAANRTAVRRRRGGATSREGD